MSEVKLGGLHVDPKHERVVVFLGAIAGLVGLMMLTKKPGSTAAGAASAIPPPGTPSSGGTGGTVLPLPAAPVLPTIHFAFGSTDSPSLEYEKSHNIAQGGGGSFSFGPIHIGGGGSGTKGDTEHVKGGANYSYTTDVTIQNADPSTLRSILDEITLLGGTQQQRTDTSLRTLQQLDKSIGMNKTGGVVNATP